MPDYLVFTLAAPMGAFGDVAGHERRGTMCWPGRSAILGLIGAAMGVRRDDREGQASLRQWKMAVATLTQSHPLRDFHTAQPVPTARIKRPNSRREALAALHPDDNPVITTRDYRTDCLFSVALWNGEIALLSEALLTPAFTLYMGRKSCPLSFPLCPKAISAETPLEALAEATLPPWHPDAFSLHVASDPYDRAEGRVETRWDEPLDRDAWHFAQRRVVYIAPDRGLK